MQIKEILEQLNECGVPASFAKFSTEQTPPFCVLREEKSHNVYSDFKMFERSSEFVAELYYRDPQDRLDFEDKLTDKFIWERETADINIGDNSQTILMAVYDLIGSGYEYIRRSA